MAVTVRLQVEPSHLPAFGTTEALSLAPGQEQIVRLARTVDADVVHTLDVQVTDPQTKRVYFLRRWGLRKPKEPRWTVVSRTAEAVVTPDEEMVDEGEHHEERQERIWVLVRKDEAHANGGLANAKGYGLKRLGDSDPRPFGFQDRIRNANGNDHELLFARNRLERVGPRQQA